MNHQEAAAKAGRARQRAEEAAQALAEVQERRRLTTALFQWKEEKEAMEAQADADRAALDALLMGGPAAAAAAAEAAAAPPAPPQPWAFSLFEPQSQAVQLVEAADCPVGPPLPRHQPTMCLRAQAAPSHPLSEACGDRRSLPQAAPKWKRCHLQLSCGGRRTTRRSIGSPPRSKRRARRATRARRRRRRRRSPRRGRSSARPAAPRPPQPARPPSAQDAVHVRCLPPLRAGQAKAAAFEAEKLVDEVATPPEPA